MSSTATKRTRQQRVFDLEFIQNHHIRGRTVRQIAELLAAERPYSVTFQQIHYDLKKIEAEWRERYSAKADAVRRKELAGLDTQEAELWKAWDKSKEEAEKKTVEQTKGGIGPGGPRSRATVTKEGQTGDPAYMRLILDVRDRRSKLLGLDAATKQEHSGPMGGPIPMQQARVVIEIPDNGRGDRTIQEEAT